MLSVKVDLLEKKSLKSIMKRIFYDSPLELLFNWSSHLSS